MRKIGLALALAGSAFLVACGGGGGGAAEVAAGAAAVSTASSNPNLSAFNASASPSVVVNFPATGVNYSSETFVSGHFGSASAECYVVQTTPRSSSYANNGSSLSLADPPVYILCSQANGTVTEVSSTLFGGQQYSIQGSYPLVGDINGDGVDDLVLFRACDCYDYQTEMHVFLSQPNGTYTHQLVAVGTTLVGGLTMHLAAGAQFSIMDIDHDGLKDIVGTAGFVFKQSPSGTFTQTQYAGALNGWQYATATCAGDFAGIGHDQLLITDRGMPDGKLQRNAIFDFDNSMTVIGQPYELPIPLFTTQYNTQTGSHNFACRTADVMKNGKPWIFIYTSNYYANAAPLTQVQVYRNDSVNGVIAFTDVTATALPGFVQAAGPSYSPRMVDVNGDGYPDVILDGQTFGGGGATSGAQVWINNKDGTFHKVFTTELTSMYAAAAASFGGGVSGEYDSMLPIQVNGKWNYLVQVRDHAEGSHIDVLNTQMVFK